MPRFSQVQSNFSSGEFGPRLKGRTDLNIYNQGVDEMLNFFPSKEGPAIRRPGSTYLGLITHQPLLHTSAVNILAADIDTANDRFGSSTGYFNTGDPVVLSSSGTLPAPLAAGTTYYLYLSGGYFFICTSRANALLGTYINLTTQGTGTHTITPKTQDISDIHFIPFQEDSETAYIVAILKLEDRIVIQIYNYSPSNFSLKYSTFSQINFQSNCVDADSMTRYGNIMPYTNDIHKIQYAQYGSTMILTCDEGNIPPIGLRIGTTFSLTHLYSSKKCTSLTDGIVPSYYTDKFFGNFFSALRKSYKDINSTDITVNTTTAIATGASGTMISSQPLFYSGMEQSFIKVTVSTSTYIVRINSITDSQTVNVTCFVGATVTTTSKLWEFQAWNDYWGHPRTVALHEQRLVFGGNTEQPDTLWFSQSGNIFFFMQKRLAQDSSADTSGLNYFGAITASDPFSLAIASDRINKLNFLASSRSLYAGTAGAENVISSSAGLSASNFQIKPESTVGSSYVQPLRVDNTVIYVSRDGRQLRQIMYNDKASGIASKDLTLQFKDIQENLINYPKKTTINQMTYSASRNMAFLLLEDPSKTEYVIVAVAIDSISDVLGASKNQLAGSGNLVKSIVCLPNADTFNDNLVMAVKRGTSFTVEEWHDDFDLTDITDYEGNSITSKAFAPVYVDCGYVTSVGSTTSISHPVLKSVNVDVLANGVLYEDVALDSSGNGTISSAATDFIIGLPYTSRLKLLPLNEGAVGGSAGIIQKKRVDMFWVKYRNSKHFKYGASANGTLYDGEIEPSLNTTTLYSGIKSKNINHSTDYEANITIETDKPYPLQILQVGYRGVTNEV